MREKSNKMKYGNIITNDNEAEISSKTCCGILKLLIHLKITMPSHGAPTNVYFIDFTETVFGMCLYRLPVLYNLYSNVCYWT